MRHTGTTARGIRIPIIRKGDDLVPIVAQSLLEASEAEGIAFHDKDVICVTEAVVARAQGNYATVDEIAEDVKNQFGGGTLGLVFPILSRNRFSSVLKALARASDKLIILLSYPTDEVGNALIDPERFEESGLNPYSDVLTEARYREIFGHNPHPFTGIDYVQYYRELCEAELCEVEILFGNKADALAGLTDDVLAADIHTRKKTARTLQAAGVKNVKTLDLLLNRPVGDSGYNEQFGLLGCNKATEESVKLFPRDTGAFVEALQKQLIEKTGKQIEVMVYGDGAFKDPAGKIWELADPVVSPAYTSGLEGRPSEMKLKYLADTEFAHLSGKELNDAMISKIGKKDKAATEGQAGLGTTPRRLTDLLGSLADLVSGSGDKGTPVVWISGYFDSLAT